MLNNIQSPATPEETAALFRMLFADKEKFVTVYGDGAPDGKATVVSLKNLVKVFPVNLSNSSLTFQCGAPLRAVAETLAGVPAFSPKPFSLYAPHLAAGLLFTHTSLFTATALFGMKVILPDGRPMTLGSDAFASVTGFNVMELFLGSKNILGVPVEYTLRLVPAARGDAREYDADLGKYERRHEEEERKVLLAVKNAYDPTHLLNTTVL